MNLQRASAEVAMSELFDEYRGTIYNLGLRLCGNPDDADDLVQETFLRGLRSWHTFHGRSNPRTWLYRIATRACLRMQRTRAGEPDFIPSVEDLFPMPGDMIADMRGFDVVDQVFRREARDIVDRAIGELPLRYRAPLVLKEIEGLSICDVADVLAIKQTTAKTRVHRARLYLNKVLTGIIPKRDDPSSRSSSEICLTLLRARQECLDRGVPFPVSDDGLQERCKVLFATLELTHEACESLRSGHTPAPVRQVLEARSNHAGVAGQPKVDSSQQPHV